MFSVIANPFSDPDNRDDGDIYTNGQYIKDSKTMIEEGVVYYDPKIKNKKFDLAIRDDVKQGFHPLTLAKPRKPVLRKIKQNLFGKKLSPLEQHQQKQNKELMEN